MEDAPSEDALEKGRLLFARPCVFLRGVARLSDLPPANLPEVAFAGRSNVGKSSLLNALTGRTALARVSRTPGRTRQINFFQADGRLMLADLPGYGYARASKRDMAEWNALVFEYLRGRLNLRRVLLLLDSRHGALANDIEVMEMLDRAAVSYQVVLTKADLPKPAELHMVVETLHRLCTSHGAAHPQILTTSAAKGTCIAELRTTLGALAA